MAIPEQISVYAVQSRYFVTRAPDVVGSCPFRDRWQRCQQHK